MEPFSYSNSNHNAPAPGPAARAPVPAPAAAPAAGAPDPADPAAGEQPKDLTLSFPNSQPEPQDEGALGDGVPEAVREYRELRRQEAPFYDATKDYQHIGLEAAAEAAGLVGDERDAVLAEQRRVFADLNFSEGEAREVVSLISQYAGGADEETQGRWANESWSALVRQYGAKEANERLALAQRLVQRDHRVKQVLEITKTGSHPKVVAKLVALAWSERAKGRL